MGKRYLALSPYSLKDMSTENTGKTEIPASGKTLLDAHKTDSFCVFAGNGDVSLILFLRYFGVRVTTKSSSF